MSLGLHWIVNGTAPCVAWPDLGHSWNDVMCRIACIGPFMGRRPVSLMERPFVTFGLTWVVHGLCGTMPCVVLACQGWYALIDGDLGIFDRWFA